MMASDFLLTVNTAVDEWGWLLVCVILWYCTLMTAEREREHSFIVAWC